jgi:hypothetical protein
VRAEFAIRGELLSAEPGCAKPAIRTMVHLESKNRGAGMANYLATVELFLAGPEDYVRLHASMKQRGYSRTISGEDGVLYQLPGGSYFTTGSSANLEVALRAAVDAAKETGKQSAVMVTDWRAATWSGLPEG